MSIFRILKNKLKFGNTFQLMLRLLIESKSIGKLASIVRDEYLDKILRAGVIKMIIPDKAQSYKRKYKLTIG
jgi:hypothetical protein